MKIQIWSDFRCPFCFVGKRKLEEALKQSNIKAEVEMMSFELDPHNAPDKTKNSYQNLADKKGISEQQAKQMFAQIADRAKEVGLNFNMETVIDANTFKAHKVLQLAKDKGFAEEFTNLGLSAHFEKGLDLDDENVLVELAKKAGLEKDDVLNAINSDEYALKVRQDQQWASSIGVRGVPHFVFDNKVSLSGAQPVEVFIEAMTYTQNLIKQEKSQENKKDDTSSNMCEDGSCSI